MVKKAAYMLAFAPHPLDTEMGMGGTVALLTQEGKEIVLKEGQIKSVLESAIQAIKMKAKTKNIALELDCEDALSGKINFQLLEQAVINLLDNSIKFSDPGTQVKVIGKSAGNETIIQVADQGCGIEKDHLPRLFERFYRIDKARSSDLGGTGLGLAIVKHIINAHSGHVTAESELGQGSTFTIHLPITEMNLTETA